MAQAFARKLAVQVTRGLVPELLPASSGAAGGLSAGCVIVHARSSGQPAFSSRSMSCTSTSLWAIFAASSGSAPRLTIRLVRQLISGPPGMRMITVSFVIAFVSLIV
jgi:hypothetical protein